MRYTTFIRGMAAALVLLVTLAAVIPASAHEQRTIAGKYDVEVGWDHEPTYIDQPNAATIAIYKTGTQQPVEGVQKTLKVRIAYGGGEPREFDLHSVFDKPGYYIATIIPTRSGSYIFTFVGDIEGTAVNERFESGPGRFDDVDSLSELQFPTSASDALTLEREVETAQRDASTARTLALVGLVTGVLGLIVGGVSLLSSRRRGTSSSRQP